MNLKLSSETRKQVFNSVISLITGGLIMSFFGGGSLWKFAIKPVKNEKNIQSERRRTDSLLQVMSWEYKVMDTKYSKDIDEAISGIGDVKKAINKVSKDFESFSNDFQEYKVHQSELNGKIQTYLKSTTYSIGIRDTIKPATTFVINEN